MLQPTAPSSRPAFEDLVERSLEIVAQAVRGEWRTLDQLNEFDDPIYMKNADAVLVHANDAFSAFFCPDGSPVGRSGQSFLETSITTVSQQSDELIAGGTTSLEFEHVGHGPDGRAYRIRTHKESLARFGNPGTALLGVSRVLEPAPDSEALQRLAIADKHRRFRALDEADREISKQIGHGKKVREIADALGLTTRAVEQRKRKILSTLELEQTVDLIKLLVRMQDRGLIDLGL